MGNYNVQITLKEKDTGRPIPGARIILKSSDPDHIGQTNSDGYIAFNNLPDIGYTVTLDPTSVQGYEIPDPLYVLYVGISATAKKTDYYYGGSYGLPVSYWYSTYDLPLTFELSYPSRCSIGTRVAIGGTLVKDPIGLQLVSVNLIHLPGYAVLSVNGTEYQITDGTYVDVVGGRVGVFGISMTGACIDIQLTFAPGPAPGPAPAPGLPCDQPLDYSGFFPFLESIYNHVKCYILQLLSAIASILSAITSIAEYLLHLSDHLDAWVSRLFGVDPALPFWDELEKKLIAMILKALSAFVSMLLPPPDFWKTHDWRKR